MMTGNLASIPFAAEQQNLFRENGFVHIEKALQPPVLHELREVLDKICENRSSKYAIGTDSRGVEYVSGINELVMTGEPFFAAFFGSPLVLSLAEKICGPDFFPVQDFCVIKKQHDPMAIVGWHQDVKSGSAGKSIMAGFYLDNADSRNGALKIIPGSHRSGLPICELEKMESADVPAQAGDAVVHDLMLAHSSVAMQEWPQRRVVYIEFMSAEKARTEKVYSEEFIQLRTRLIPAFQKLFRARFPGEEEFEWNHPQRDDYPEPEDAEAVIREIYNMPFHMKASNYCFPEMASW